MPDVSETLPPEGHWVAPPVRAMKQKNKTESFISILFPRSDQLSSLSYEKKKINKKNISQCSLIKVISQCSLLSYALEVQEYSQLKHNLNRLSREDCQALCAAW